MKTERRGTTLSADKGTLESRQPPHILTITELADEGELFILPKCQLTSDGSLVISLDQWLQAASARLGSVQEMNVEQGQVASGYK
jgi:hypothetical protein